MATYAEAIQQEKSVVYGSCKIEVSTDSGVNWTPLGASRGVVFNEQQTVTEIQADNAPNISTYVSEHNVNITLNGLEFYPPTLNIIRGGLDNYSITTGGVVTTDTVVKTTGSWSRNVPYYFTNQGNTDTLPAIVTVKSVSTANTTVVLDSTSDYTTFTDANNKSGIIVLSTGVGGGTTGLTSQSLRIEYQYESIPAYKLSSGGKSIISSRWYRLTNKQVISGVDKYRYLVVYSGSINAGFNLAFKSSNEADPVLENPISIIAKLDSSRTSGDQLFYIEDEVAAS